LLGVGRSARRRPVFAGTLPPPERERGSRPEAPLQERPGDPWACSLQATTSDPRGCQHLGRSPRNETLCRHLPRHRRSGTGHPTACQATRWRWTWQAWPVKVRISPRVGSQACSVGPTAPRSRWVSARCENKLWAPAGSQPTLPILARTMEELLRRTQCTERPLEVLRGRHCCTRGRRRRRCFHRAQAAGEEPGPMRPGRRVEEGEVSSRSSAEPPTPNGWPLSCGRA